MITTEVIKELREQTGVSVMQCKKALEEAGGDVAKALVILQKKGAEIAAKKGDRTLLGGAVAAYVHGNSVGALVVLRSETDFVAKNEEFIALARDIAMHVAAMNPQFLSADDITPDAKKIAEEVFMKEVEGLPAQAGKPSDLKEKILAGKLDAYFKERTLLEQPFIKDPEITIGGILSRAVQKFGEKIQIQTFVRLSAK